MPLRVAFEGAKFWSVFGLLAIIFAPDMLGSQSRALIEVDFDLVFQLNFESKNGPLGQRPGPGKDGQNNT